MITLSGQNIGFKHSIEEQWTGEYWIDGSKIYTKTLTIPNIAAGREVTINHAITNIGNHRCIDYDNSFLCSGDDRYTLSNYLNSTAFASVRKISTTSIVVVVGGNYAFASGYITIRYTCTNR